MQATPFEYKKGNAIISMPYFRPDPHLLNGWRDKFLKIKGTEKYKFWICGGAIEGWETWDADIVISGEIDDFEELRNIMEKGTQLGLEHRQLIDLYWCGHYEKYFEKGSCSRQGICCETYYRTGACTISECLRQVKIETICAAISVERNGQEVWQATEPEEISPDLWKLQSFTPSPKQIQRIKNGLFYTTAPALIAPDLDFKKVVNWS